MTETVNGQLLINFKDYIQKKWGKDGLDKANDDLDFDIKEITNERDYPMQHMFASFDYLRTNFGMLEIFNFGKFTTQNIGTKRYLATFLPPDKILERLEESVPKLTELIKVDVTNTDNGAVITFQAPHMRDTQCEYWRGLLHGALELTKTKGTVDMDASQMESQHTVVYTMKW